MELVSIITPTYNSSQYIEETIESIISQTYKNWELLITDDCSSDETFELIKKYSAKDPRIKVFQLTVNSGPGVARNNSIKQAKGRYIAFCDSDDLWQKEKLSKQLKFMKENNVGFSFTGLYHMDENGNLLKKIDVPKKVGYVDLLKKNSIGCLTAMYDSKRIGKKYMPKIGRRQDYALWLKIIKDTQYAYGLNEPLAYYRERKSSISSSKLKLIKYNWLVLREQEKKSFLKSIYYLSFIIINSLKKYYLWKK